MKSKETVKKVKKVKNMPIFSDKDGLIKKDWEWQCQTFRAK